MRLLNNNNSFNCLVIGNVNLLVRGRRRKTRIINNVILNPAFCKYVIIVTDSDDNNNFN